MDEINQLLSYRDRKGENRILDEYQDLSENDKSILKTYFNVSLENVVKEVRLNHTICGTSSIKGMIKNYFDEIDD